MKTIPSHRHGRVPAAPPGFTLIELVIATTIGAMLLVAVAEVAQIFGHEVEIVRDETDWRLEECLVRVTDDAKRAWVVESEDEHELVIVDALGGETTFSLEGSNLLVTRPNGSQGVMLEGVADFHVEKRMAQRLREAEQLESYGSFWQSPEIVGGTQSVTVEQELPVALGFTMSSAAPDWAHAVEGVDEQSVQAMLERVVLPLAFVPPQTNPGTSGGVVETGDTGGTDTGSSGKGKGKGLFNFGSGAGGGGSAGDDDDTSNAAGGGGKGSGKGSDGGSGTGGDTSGGSGGDTSGSSGQVSICHIPPGNPENARTLNVVDTLVAPHLAHGDVLGACSASGSTASSSVLHIDLYEAYAPDDGRPYGNVLGTISVPVSALPAGTATWEDSSLVGGLTGGGSAHVTICHVPPGNPGNVCTLSVGEPAVQGHLNHGDVLGSCEDGGSTSETVLVYQAPTTAVPLDLTPFAAVIEPGRAHTLVFRLEGPGTVVLAGVPLQSSSNTGIAAVSWGGGGYEPQPLAVPRALDGMRTYTQTEATDVVEALTVSFAMLDGKRASATATIMSQSTVANPWLGPLPGELPELELDGQ